jgi:hypothetical protein
MEESEGAARTRVVGDDALEFWDAAATINVTSKAFHEMRLLECMI